jgi:hypothetical protein
MFCFGMRFGFGYDLNTLLVSVQNGTKSQNIIMLLTVELSTVKATHVPTVILEIDFIQIM